MLNRILSFFFMLFLSFSSFFGIEQQAYESKALFKDSEFENGFTVMSQQTVNNSGIPLGNFSYRGTDRTPSWMIAQWNSGPCLWADKITADDYTITDGETKWVTYNPIDNSVSMRLNAANVYKGEAATAEAWPHLLLEQSPICDYFSLSPTDKAFYNCSADHMVLSLDIKITDFKDTTNSDGINAVQYLAYFYLKGNDNNKFIWFGVNLFDSRGAVDTYWALDEASQRMIYCVSTKDTYGSLSRSLIRNKEPFISDEWVHIELDLSPHIAQAIKAANESDTFGTTVTQEDFYIGGTNIGYEIHGNYDCTIVIKDFQIISYNLR